MNGGGCSQRPVSEETNGQHVAGPSPSSQAAMLFCAHSLGGAGKSHEAGPGPEVEEEHRNQQEPGAVEEEHLDVSRLAGGPTTSMQPGEWLQSLFIFYLLLPFQAPGGGEGLLGTWVEVCPSYSWQCGMFGQDGIWWALHQGHIKFQSGSRGKGVGY